MYRKEFEGTSVKELASRVSLMKNKKRYNNKNLTILLIPSWKENEVVLVVESHVIMHLNVNMRRGVTILLDQRQIWSKEVNCCDNFSSLSYGQHETISVDSGATRYIFVQTKMSLLPTLIWDEEYHLYLGNSQSVAFLGNKKFFLTSHLARPWLLWSAQCSYN